MTTTSAFPAVSEPFVLTRPVRPTRRPRAGHGSVTVRLQGATVLPLHACRPVPARGASRRVGCPDVGPAAGALRLRTDDAVVASSAVHLTRRGWVLLLGLTTVVTAALLVVAALSQPAAQAAQPIAVAAAAPSQVVVHTGDTLWSIASRVAPGRDPRAVVDELQRRNHLTSPAVVPGQVLRVA